MNTHDLVRQAEEFCRKAHLNQKRDDGKPYSTHPVAVAEILRQRGHTDSLVLAVALLHDTVEDTATTKADLETAFGAEVADLVIELTNPLPQDRPFAEKHVALLKHAATMSDRARLVKLADRLHNLRDMRDWPTWKQHRYAKAAMELLESLRPWPDQVLAALVREEVVRVLTG
jgi:GTP diphosphokinase / guanosine-3',5'-bis(diphosphate) 3'-diphosphatase